MLEVFRKFLDLISKIDILQLAFVQMEDGIWKSTNVMEQGYISYRSNFIIEPANPYNDMAEKLEKNFLEKIKRYSVVTKTRFESVEEMVFKIKGTPYLPFDMLFDPLPTNISESFKFEKPKKIGVFSINDYNCVNPDLKIKNEEKFKNREMQQLKKAIQGYLFSTVNSTVRSQPQGTVSRIAVRERVQQMVDVNISDDPEKPWETINMVDIVEDYDMTFIYPISGGPEKNAAVRLGLSW